MRRVRPSDVEQVFQVDRICLVCLQKTIAISRVDRSLLTGKKASSDPGARRAERQCRGKTPSIRYAAGGNHGRWGNSIDDGWYERHCRPHSPHMPACFPPLRDDYIDAAVYRPLRVGSRTDGIHDDGAAVLCTRYQSRGVSPKQRYDRDVLFETDR